jgi:hypothetical protein
MSTDRAEALARELGGQATLAGLRASRVSTGGVVPKA